jgi:ferredoxin
MEHQDKTNIHKLAKLSGKPDSEAFLRILDCAMSDEEAAFVMAMPASYEELAAKFGMGKQEAADKVLGLAQRGLLSRSPDDCSPEKFRFPNIPAILHDNILASAPRHVPADMPKLWMDLYTGEDWCKEIGDLYRIFQDPLLRVIPAQQSIPPELTLMPSESISEIIQANRDLITVRNCCCRVGADKCHHPRDVCMQFKGRAEFDLARGSGRKVNADEAVSVALTSLGAGLVPTVTNISATDKLEFICFCCGCACMVLHPGIQAGSLPKILAPSRYEARVDNDACDGCEHCVIRCQFGAIEMKPDPDDDTMKAVIDQDKCYGCGVCDLPCVPGAISMEEKRPKDFIPEGVKGEEILHF